MKKKNITEQLENEFKEKTTELYKKLENEKDELKQSKIFQNIQEISFSVVLNAIKNLKDSEWDQFLTEQYVPIQKQVTTLTDKFDVLMHNRSKHPKEFKKYEKQKNVVTKGLMKSFQQFDEINLNKKQLERYIQFVFRNLFEIQNIQSQDLLNFYELHEARNIVNTRLGFDYDWLVCMSLIQLHENLIKKKITELKGKIEDHEKMKSLISKLSSLIKKEEKRDISLGLLFTNSIKIVRDTMTHEGYKHSVSKSDLLKLLKEIRDLEDVLYPPKTK